MKFFVFLVPTFLISLTLQAQIKTVKVETPTYEKGWAYEDYPFPDGIKVYKLNKEKHVLKAEGLTLVQLWSIDAGGDPQTWRAFEKLIDKYKGKGLKTISVNFENGVDFKVQQAMLKKFFATTKEPENFYFDYMGYSVDMLRTPGFPMYSLVDKNGRVVFRTNGKDAEGMDILDAELNDRLNGVRK